MTNHPSIKWTHKLLSLKLKLKEEAWSERTFLAQASSTLLMHQSATLPSKVDLYISIYLSIHLPKEDTILLARSDCVRPLSLSAEFLLQILMGIHSSSKLQAIKEYVMCVSHCNTVIRFHNYYNMILFFKNKLMILIKKRYSSKLCLQLKSYVIIVWNCNIWLFRNAMFNIYNSKFKVGKITFMTTFDKRRTDRTRYLWIIGFLQPYSRLNFLIDCRNCCQLNA